MSSITMHIAISEKLKERFLFSDEFILGAVLPDMYKKIINDRDATHFILKKDGKELPDLEAFCKKYKETKNELTYGYLAHLVEDKIWFEKYINDKYTQKINENEVIYLKDNSVHEMSEYLKDIYNDYSWIDEYIRDKNKINLEQIKSKIKLYIKENKELLDTIEKNIIKYPIVQNRENVLFREYDADEYFELTLKETEKILKAFIKSSAQLEKLDK